MSTYRDAQARTFKETRAFKQALAGGVRIAPAPKGVAPKGLAPKGLAPRTLPRIIPARTVPAFAGNKPLSARQTGGRPAPRPALPDVSSNAPATAPAALSRVAADAKPTRAGQPRNARSSSDMVTDTMTDTLTGTGAPTAAPMLTDWSADKTARFQKAILDFRHDLASTGLFTDAALTDLLRRHPSELLDVCTMSHNDPRFPNRFRTGDFRGVAPETLLAAARSGKVWINVRNAMNVHADYRAVLERMYGELAERTGSAAFNAKGGVLISSPIARVPYHVDKTETILWHVRGKKRIYLYPRSDDFIPDASYEATLTDLINDDLPYHASMDASATVIDLEEGQALTWPLNSPHRVDNSTFCVSVTTEYSTRESAIKNATMMTNAMLRARFGLNPSFERDGPLARRTKSLMGRALNRVGLIPKSSRPDMVTFRVDAGVEGFLVDTDPYVRDF